MSHRGEREICGGVEEIKREAESSKRAPETRNRRRDREREADSSREMRNRQPERERGDDSTDRDFG